MQNHLILWTVVATVVRSQISHVELSAPDKLSMRAVKEFYVYSFDEAPDRPLGRPFIQFKKFSAKFSEAQSKSDYKGIQVSVVKHSDFENLIDPKRFCCSAADISSGNCDQAGQLLLKKGKVSADDYSSHLVSASSTDGKEVKLRTTGVYVLFISNCGNEDGGTISGDVVVSHAYGYLPGNEYHKMPLFFWLIVIYVVLSLVWMVVLHQWSSKVTSIHKSIFGILLGGLLESIVWYLLYYTWNSTGERKDSLLGFAIILSAVKSTYSCVMILMLSLGWSVTRPYLDKALMQKIQLLAILYVICDASQQFVMSADESLSLTVAVCIIVPASIVSAGMFFWIFTAMTNTIEVFRERRQFDKLGLFQQLLGVLLIAIVVCTMGLASEVLAVTKFPALEEWAHYDGTWKSEWIGSSAVPHGVYIAALAVVMYLLAPFKGQLAGGAVAPEEGKERKGDVDDVFAEQDDEKEDASFWAGGKAIGNAADNVNEESA